MIWILLFYVLPFLIGCIVLYYITKKEEETIMYYLKGVLFCLLPLFNILIIVIGVYTLIEEFLEENEEWQNFINKKL